MLETTDKDNPPLDEILKIRIENAEIRTQIVIYQQCIQEIKALAKAADANSKQDAQKLKQSLSKLEKSITAKQKEKEERSAAHAKKIEKLEASIEALKASHATLNPQLSNNLTIVQPDDSSILKRTAALKAQKKAYLKQKQNLLNEKIKIFETIQQIQAPPQTYTKSETHDWNRDVTNLTAALNALKQKKEAALAKFLLRELTNNAKLQALCDVVAEFQQTQIPYSSPVYATIPIPPLTHLGEAADAAPSLNKPRA